MALFFLFLLRVAYHHNVLGGGPKGSPSVEAYCPFGGIESAYTFLTTGGYMRRIEPSAMILLAALMLLTLVFSRGFCGWVCPFGSLQEWLGLLGRKIFGKSYNLPGVWDRRLRPLKYVILAVIVGLTWYAGTLIFRPFDPFLAFFHLGSHFNEMPYAYGALAVVTAGSLKIDRFFCKYACPLGAVLGVLGRFGLTRLQRDPSDCKECNVCQKKCFAQVDFLKRTEVRDVECNHCLDCLEACPRPNVLVLRGLRFRFSHTAYAGALVLGLLGLVGVSKMTAAWRTKPEAVELKDAKGVLDPAQIRGWMTLKEVSDGYGIPLQELYRRSGLPARVVPETRLNQVGTNYHLEFEADAVRDAVAGKLDGKPAAKQGTERSKKSKSSGASHDEQEVKGMMTLNEISLKTGVAKDAILKAMGLEKAGIDPRVPVREWVHENGRSVPEMREAIAKLKSKHP